MFKIARKRFGTRSAVSLLPPTALSFRERPVGVLRLKSPRDFTHRQC